MPEILSRGFSGTVYRITAQERLRFPHADLVKVDSFDLLGVRDPLKEYYKHKIAHLMAPKYITNPIAVNYRASKGNQDPFNGEYFFVESPVNPDHAIFTSHMDETKGSQPRGIHTEPNKIVTCNCEACFRHNALHSDKKFQKRAEEVGYKLWERGVSIPYRDITDYCLAGNQLVFFEVNGITVRDALDYLGGLKKLTREQRIAQGLLPRYKEKFNIRY